MSAAEDAVFSPDTLEKWTAELAPYGRVPGDETFPRYRCEACEPGRWSDGVDDLSAMTGDDLVRNASNPTTMRFTGRLRDCLSSAVCLYCSSKRGVPRLPREFCDVWC